MKKNEKMVAYRGEWDPVGEVGTSPEKEERRRQKRCFKVDEMRSYWLRRKKDEETEDI